MMLNFDVWVCKCMAFSFKGRGVLLVVVAVGYWLNLATAQVKGHDFLPQVQL